MAAWKVLFIGAYACVCLGLALSTIVVPLSHEGGQRWMWLGGLLTATLCAGTLFAFFLRYVSGSLDAKPQGGRR